MGKTMNNLPSEPNTNFSGGAPALEGLACHNPTNCVLVALACATRWGCADLGALAGWVLAAATWMPNSPKTKPDAINLSGTGSIPGM